MQPDSGGCQRGGVSSMTHLQVAMDRKHPPAAYCRDAFQHGSLAMGKVFMSFSPDELTDQLANHACKRIWSGMHIGTKHAAMACGA